MTLTQAERITGMAIVRLREGPRYYFRASGAGEEYETEPSSYRDEAIQIQVLVEIVYRSRSERSRRDQGQRCFFCARLQPLQSDHIIKRSRGRDDRRENLRSVCAECHNKRHSSRELQATLKPDRMVLESVERLGGLTWAGEESGWRSKSSM